MNTIFSIKEAYKWAWQRFKEHFQFLAITVIVLVLVSILLDSLAGGKHDQNIFVVLIQVIFGVISAVGAIRISLNIHNNVKPQVQDFYITIGIFWRYLVVQIASSLLIVLGLVLLIVPGLYILSRLQLALFVLVDDKPEKPLDALKKSWNMTKGVTGKMFLLVLSLVAINIIGAIPFGLGLLVTIPISFLSLAFVYKKLEGGVVENPPLENPKSPTEVPAQTS